MEGEFVLVSKRNSRGKKSKGSKVKHACLLSCSDAPSEFGDDCYEKSMANIYECKYVQSVCLLPFYLLFQ